MAAVTAAPVVFLRRAHRDDVERVAELVVAVLQDLPRGGTVIGRVVAVVRALEFLGRRGGFAAGQRKQWQQEKGGHDESLYPMNCCLIHL